MTALTALKRVEVPAPAPDTQSAVPDEQARLLSELVRLGATPFSNKSVSRYKLRQAISNTKLDIDIWTHASGLAMFVFGALSAGFFWSATYLAGDAALVCVILAVVFLGATILFGYLVWDFGVKLDRAFWELVPISEYREAIPLQAADLAVAILSAVPDVSFSIDALRTERLELLDPFLVVERDGIKYYVAAWLEPGLHQELITV